MKKRDDDMLISRQSDYAIRIIRALSDMKMHSAPEIESKEKVTVAFCYKILKKLEKAGLVNTIRGANGGYMLTKGCDQFTLFDIISAVDEDFVINECIRDGYICSRCDSECLVHNELLRIQKILIDEMKSKTMADVLECK